MINRILNWINTFFKKNNGMIPENNFIPNSIPKIFHIDDKTGIITYADNSDKMEI